jgi:hypothetical protein
MFTLLVAPAIVLFQWSAPAPVAPREMPALVLDPAAVDDQLARDERAAAQAPSGEAAEQRRRAYRELNMAERAATDTQETAARKLSALRDALARVVEANGVEANGVEANGVEIVERVRAADLAPMEATLRGRRARSGAEPAAELGGFLEMMERYDLSRDGRQRAPTFVVRTLFKARWNSLHGLEPTEGLSPIELQAYWGWLALGAEGAPVEARLGALDRLAEAGGHGVHEARAVLLFGQGRFEDARASFLAAAAEAPSFRLRNHALACDLPPSGATSAPRETAVAGP